MGGFLKEPNYEKLSAFAPSSKPPTELAKTKAEEITN